MFLNEENLSVQHDLTFQLERAFEEQTLENFIMDYLGFGTGTIEDIYNAISHSSTIETSDIDKAVNWLKQNNLLKEEKSPYDELIEKYNEVKDCGDDNTIFEEVNQLYFVNMGNKNWDDAYNNFVNNYESGKLEEQISNSDNQFTLLEYFKSSRLTTVAKKLDATTSEFDRKKWTDYYKKIAHKLYPVNKVAALTKWKDILVYEVGDQGVLTYLQGANEEVFKKIKGWTYGKSGNKLYFFFANQGAFNQLNQALDRLEITSADETDVETEPSTAPAGVDVTKPKTITLHKKENGLYWVEVPVLGDLLKDKRYNKESDALKDIAATLKKYKLDYKDFKEKIQRTYTEDETGATVDRDPDTREVTAYKGIPINKCLFIINGTVYNYTAYKKLPDKKRRQAVVINNSTNVLLNRNPETDIVTEDIDQVIRVDVLMNRLTEDQRKSLDILYRPLNEFIDRPSRSSVWDDDYEDDEIDRLYHDASEDELRQMGAFDNLNDEEDDPWLDESYEDSEDVDYMTVNDLIAGLVDNASDQEINRQLRLFRQIAKLLEVPNYDNIIVAVDDGDYNPEYIFSDGLPMPSLAPTVTFYPDAKMVSEVLNGQIFLYFKDEEACKKFFHMAKKFLTDFDLDENQFDADHAAEWMERNPHGYYNSESDYGTDVEVVDIEEALNYKDKISNNQFDLLNNYLSERFTLDQRKILATMIRENKSNKDIYEYLVENKATEKKILF